MAKAKPVNPNGVKINSPKNPTYQSQQSGKNGSKNGCK